MRIKTVVSTTQFSAIVSVLLAMSGWSVTHVVDRVLASPTAEYSISPTKNADGSTRIEVAFANLSMDKEFKRVTIFLVRQDETLKFGKFEVKPRAPFYVKPEDSKPSVTPDSVKVEIGSWPPKAEWVLVGSYTGDGHPVVQYQSPEGPVVLTERSAETSIVRNELCILISLAVFWIVVAGFLLCVNSSLGVRVQEASDVPSADGHT